MSRSRKKNGFVGHTKAESDRPFKTITNRCFRHHTKQITSLIPTIFDGLDFDEVDTPYFDVRQVSDAYDSNKDGKMYFRIKKTPYRLRNGVLFDSQQFVRK